MIVSQNGSTSYHQRLARWGACLVALYMVCLTGLCNASAPSFEFTNLLERFSGRIAVLPTPGIDGLPATSAARALERAGVLPHLRLLTPAELADTNHFNPERFPLALYLGYESYYQTVKGQGDGDRAMVAYLRRGGALMVLPSGPFPFYYNQANQPVSGHALLGINIGTGSFETPPSGLTLNFRAAASPEIVKWPETNFPFPSAVEADQRWRPMRPSAPSTTRYVPLLTLYDQNGGNHGEGVALVEHTAGPLASGRVFHAWFSLLEDEALMRAILEGAFRYLLRNVPLPTAVYACPRLIREPSLTNLGDQLLSNGAPLSSRFFLPGREGSATNLGQIRFRAGWDDKCLYLACHISEMPDQALPRDLTLWCWPRGNTGEVKTVTAKLEVPQLGTEERIGNSQLSMWRISKGSNACHAFGAIPWTVLGLDGPPRCDSELNLQLACLGSLRERAEKLEWMWSPDSRSETHLQPGRFLLGAASSSDDFERRTAVVTPSADWRLTSGQWKLEQGRLVGSNCVGDGFGIGGASRGDARWRDYICTVRFRIESRGSDWRDGPWIGIRSRPDGDGYFITFTSQDCQLHKIIYGLSTSDANPMARAPWKTDQEWHTLWVSAQSNRLTAELDGRPLFDVVDNAYMSYPSMRSGGIVLAARKGSVSQGATVIHFDDVEVTLK